VDREQLSTTLTSAIDTLADIEHERWAHWQKYMHEKGERQPDGSLLIPADLVAQWDRQIATPFAELSQDEKDSDRDQVQKYLPTVVAILSGDDQC
jgi:hypothetical protein